MKYGKITLFSAAVFMMSMISAGPSVLSEELPPLPKGPLILTSVRPEQLKAEYWINRLPNPDQVILTPSQRAAFNEDIRHIIKERVDIFKLSARRAGKDIRDAVDLNYNTLRGRVLFGADNKRIPKSLFDQTIQPVIRSDKIPAQISVRWGAAVRATSVRALPTDVKMIEEVGDFEFDQLQFTQIKIWTPVAVYHESGNGQWYFIQAPYVRGWVKAKDIAIFSSRDSLKKYADPEKFLVVTGESAAVFTAADRQTVLRRASMGTVLPLASAPAAGAPYEVSMPARKADGSVSVEKRFVSRKSDVSEGYLPYTRRNIIRQAFKLLGARYGWGGMYDGRDCSGFIQDVFLSLGIDMPRDSKHQGYIGTQISHFEPFEGEGEKKYFLSRAEPAVTILRMPKHMMLYLGQENGQFYVIHSTWAERISMTSDEKNRINQVVVSDLNLNGRSRIGSLFDRIISMNEAR